VYHDAFPRSHYVRPSNALSYCECQLMQFNIIQNVIKLVVDYFFMIYKLVISLCVYMTLSETERLLSLINV